MLGHVDKSVEFGQRSIENDPISNIARHFHARALIAAGRLDEAEASLRKAIELAATSERNFMQLAIIEILRGHAAAALALAGQEPNEFWRTFALALAYFANGDRADADKCLQMLVDR